MELTYKKGIPGVAGDVRGMGSLGRFRHLAAGEDVVVPAEHADQLTEAEDPYSVAEVLGKGGDALDEARAAIQAQMVNAPAQPITMPLIRTLIGAAAVISFFSNFANGVPFIIRAGAAAWGLYPVAVPLLRR